MNLNLINLLTDYQFHENEKSLFLKIEDFLINEYAIRPILMFSTHQQFERLELSKCRFVIGKNDRLKLYGEKSINHILKECEDIVDKAFILIDSSEFNYYVINHGVKGAQFYFSIFSVDKVISEETLVAISKFSNMQMQIISKFDELSKAQELIHIDDVTGLYNQRKLYKDLQGLVEKFNLEGDHFSVLFIDIDHFKRVNDNYGHLIGTKLLEAIAFDIKSMLRDTDIMYRYGGDEFVVILPGAGAGSGKMVGERLLQKVKNKNYDFTLSEKVTLIKLSVSIGVAEFPMDAKTSEDVLVIADRMMYEAKESGRGIVFNTNDVFKSALKKVVTS